MASYTPPSRIDTKGLLRFCWRIAIRPNWGRTLGILLLIAAGSLVQMAAVGLMMPLLDAITNPSWLDTNRRLAVLAGWMRWLGCTAQRPALLFGILTLTMTLFVLCSALVFWQNCATAKLAMKLRWRIKSLLFERFLRARYEPVSQKPRGQMVQFLTDVPEDVYSTITSLEQFATGLLTCAVMVGLMMALSWWATLAVGILAVGGVQGWRAVTERRAAASGRTMYELRGSQTKLEIDAIDGLKVVKAHGLEVGMVERQQGLVCAEYPAKRRLVYCAYGPGVVNEAIGAAIVLLLGAATFLAPSSGISFSMLVVFLVALRRIAGSMATINAATVSINRAKRGLEVVEEVLEHLDQERRGGVATGPVERIEFHGVSFVYSSRPQRPVVSGVTQTMRRGTITAIVGSTGSGKSTIANLLLGLYEPTSGTILVNGVPLGQMDLGGWRAKIGYVSQDVFLFNASIRENIALGAPVTDAQIDSAAGIAQFHAFVAGLPQGYQTQVGDRGLQLSGGQCQRLAIARAVIRRPDVLIFDEATSALDGVTEQAVFRSIRSLRKDALVIVIAHRLSTVRDADRILVLKSGQVVETGTHEALLAQDGIYARLYGSDGQAWGEDGASGEPPDAALDADAPAGAAMGGIRAVDGSR